MALDLNHQLYGDSPREYARSDDINIEGEMELSASMDVVAIVIVLLVVVVGYVVSSYRQYKMLGSISRKLASLLGEDKGNNDDTTNTQTND